MALKPITVTQLNEYLDRIVKNDPIMSNVVIKGELSGVKYHASGHIYFSLVDSGSRLNCFYSSRLVPNLKDVGRNGGNLHRQNWNIYRWRKLFFVCK